MQSLENLKSVEEIHQFLILDEKGKKLNIKNDGFDVQVNYTGRKYFHKRLQVSFRLNDLVKRISESTENAEHDTSTNRKVNEILARVRHLDKRGDSILGKKNILIQIATFFRRLFGNLGFDRHAVLKSISKQFDAVLDEKSAKKKEMKPSPPLEQKIKKEEAAKPLEAVQKMIPIVKLEQNVKKEEIPQSSEPEKEEMPVIKSEIILSEKKSEKKKKVKSRPRKNKSEENSSKKSNASRFDIINGFNKTFRKKTTGEEESQNNDGASEKNNTDNAQL